MQTRVLLKRKLVGFGKALRLSCRCQCHVRTRELSCNGKVATLGSPGHSASIIAPPQLQTPHAGHAHSRQSRATPIGFRAHADGHLLDEPRAPPLCSLLQPAREHIGGGHVLELVFEDEGHARRRGIHWAAAAEARASGNRRGG